MQVHGNLTAIRRDLTYDSHHYALYLRYQRYRHPGGGMDQDSREQYQHFLLHSNVATDLVRVSRERGPADGQPGRPAGGRPVVRLHVLRAGRARARATASTTSCGRSSAAASLGLPYLYLGYWIEESQKMAYKATFRPIEGLVGRDVDTVSVSTWGHATANSRGKSCAVGIDARQWRFGSHARIRAGSPAWRQRSSVKTNRRGPPRG